MLAIPRERGWLASLRPCTVRREFPLRAAYVRQVLPLVVGFPHLRVLCLIRHPSGIRRSFPFTVLLRLPARRSVPSGRLRLGLCVRVSPSVPKYPYALRRTSHRQELVGFPKFSHASLPACHGLSTPADLPTLAVLPSGVLVLPSVGVEPLGVRYLKFRSCTSTSGRAGTPTAYRILCLRFAQVVRSLFIILLSLLRTGRKTRYGWLARPYPAGTFTLQEAPSFLGARTFVQKSVARFSSP